MNPPQVYMCSPSWTLLPHPSPYHPSGSSQCTSPKHPVSCIEPELTLTSIWFCRGYFLVEGLGAGGEGDDRGWDGWMASLTWVWVNSGSWWWTGRPGVLWFMGSGRVGHEWATELNWTEVTKTPVFAKSNWYSSVFNLSASQRHGLQVLLHSGDCTFSPSSVSLGESLTVNAGWSQVSALGFSLPLSLWFVSVYLIFFNENP